MLTARDVDPLVLELLAEGMSVEVPVTGDSMSPFIRDLDVVTLVPLGHEPPRRGDVVAFPRPDGRLVIHRVVASAGGRLRTRGDAAGLADGWIDAEILIGRVEKIERRGRRVRLGLGAERALIALLSRAGLLAPLLRPVRWLVK